MYLFIGVYEIVLYLIELLFRNIYCWLQCELWGFVVYKFFYWKSDDFVCFNLEVAVIIYQEFNYVAYELWVWVNKNMIQKFSFFPCKKSLHNSVKNVPFRLIIMMAKNIRRVVLKIVLHISKLLTHFRFCPNPLVKFWLICKFLVYISI